MTHPNQTPWDATVLAEISQAPYTTMADDATIAAALNALTVPGPTQILSKEFVLAALRTDGVWLAIKASALPAAVSAVDLFDDPEATTIDLTNPLIVESLAALVTADLMTQAQSTALQALAQTTSPWWQSIGAGSPLNQYDIARAREN